MLNLFNSRFKVLLTASGIFVTVAASVLVVFGTTRPKAPAEAGAARPVQTGAGTNHPVHIREPRGTPRVITGRTNLNGELVSVSCSTCHATTQPNGALKDANDLREFHQGLTFNHGHLTCLSCHNSGDYDSLRLADGSALDYKNVQQLCGQCHGPQTRDYRNGSHGGMNGHWDLKRGPRTRNTCTDCHDPHSPQYQAMMPVFPPAPAHRTSDPGH